MGSANRSGYHRHRLHGAWDPAVSDETDEDDFNSPSADRGPPAAPTEIGASGFDTKPEAISSPAPKGGFFASPPAKRGPPVAPTKLPPPAGRRLNRPKIAENLLTDQE